MTVELKVDFYRVEMPEGCNTSFETVVETVDQSPNDESRNVDVGLYPVRLQESHQGRKYLEADLLKIQMHAIPPKANLRGKVAPLGLKVDEGLGGETAFLYDQSARILVIQRNRAGVSATALASYFQEAGSLSGPIRLLPVIQADALKKLAKMKEIRRMEIHFAGVTNPELFSDSGAGLGEFIEILDFFKAPSASVAVSMGRESGSLPVGKVIKLAKHVLHLSNESDKFPVTKLEVTGLAEDEERDVLDLLKYRMIESVNVDESSQRQIKYGKRRPKIKEAWNRRREELAELWPPENE